MNVHTLQEADSGTDLEVPPPVLFNTYKHHAGALRRRIDRAAAHGGIVALGLLGKQLAVLGTRLMDVYTGPLTPAQLGQRVLEWLQVQGHAERDRFAAWLTSQRDYTTLTIDGANWVLRDSGDATRWVHLHPGRWSPQTLRARANAIKTAALAQLHARIHGNNPRDLATMNALRREHLSLPPLAKVSDDDEGVGVLLELLA